MNANLGLNPQNNGDVLLIAVPPLTEERRRDLVKKAKAEGEHAKVGVRNNRKDSMDMIKDLKSELLNSSKINSKSSVICQLFNFLQLFQLALLQSIGVNFQEYPCQIR